MNVGPEDFLAYLSPETVVASVAILTLQRETGQPVPLPRALEICKALGARPDPVLAATIGFVRMAKTRLENGDGRCIGIYRDRWVGLHLDRGMAGLDLSDLETCAALALHRTLDDSRCAFVVTVGQKYH